MYCKLSSGFHNKGGLPLACNTGGSAKKPSTVCQPQHIGVHIYVEVFPAVKTPFHSIPSNMKQTHLSCSFIKGLIYTNWFVLQFYWPLYTKTIYKTKFTKISKIYINFLQIFFLFFFYKLIGLQPKSLAPV